jgi:uncharacterized protein YyaL (SSP411 family)
MLDTFLKGHELKHTWKNGIAKIAANLEDHAFLINALLELAHATGEETYLLKADEMTTQTITLFQHESGNFFYFSSSTQTDIPVRKVDIYDGALPSANAVMVHNMLLIGLSMERTKLLEQAYFMLEQLADTALRYTGSFAYWARLLQRHAKGGRVTVCCGRQANTAHKLLLGHFLPHNYIITSKKEISDIAVAKDKYFSGDLRIFVCTHHACLPPIADLERALDLIRL